MGGRPKADGPRHPCGKLVQATPATTELLDKRRILVGDKADDPRAGYPLGILYLRGAIMHGDYAAGMRFGALYASIWGRGSIKSHLENVLYGLSRGIDLDDDAEREKLRIKHADELGEATAALLALPTRRPYHVLTNLAVYERPMRFMDSARSRTPEAWRADQRDLEALTDATGALATLWKIERKAT